METLIAESNDSSNNYMTIELSGVEIGFQFSILFTIFIKPSVVKFFQGLHRETSNRFYFIFKWKFNLILPCFLSCNWHTLKSPIGKHRVQWCYSVHKIVRASLLRNSRIPPSRQRGTRYPLGALFIPPLLPVPAKHKSTFCLYRVANSGYVM